MAELNKIIKRIMVDAADQHRNTTVRAKQGDKATRCVSVLILDNGKEYEIPADAVLRVNFQKPDGHYCYNTATRDTGTNRVLVSLTNQMLAVAGRAECEVEITTPDASQTLTSAVFTVEIERGLHNEGAIKSSDEMTALEAITAKAEQAMTDAKAASDKAVEAAGAVEEARQAATDAAAAAQKSGIAAETAATAAQQSEKKATAAEQRAAQAKEQAEAARAEAETAKETVEAAKASAEESAQKAATAEKAATDAAKNSETAKTGAEAAQSSARAAQSAAESAKQGTLEAKAEAEAAEKKAKSASETATEAATKAAAAQTATESAKAEAEKQATKSEECAVNAAKSETASAESAAKSEKFYNSMVRDDTAKVKTDVLFRYPRTGKIYTVKIPKYAANQATTCEKLDDNAGLVCEPSTDTVEGRDDYADIPLFRWYNCNYLREANGHAYPTAIEGLDDAYTTEGNVDVGVIQMAPYIKWDDSNDDYTLLSITDSPKEGYTLWRTARYGEETFPYVIHSKYFSGAGPDGLPRSLPGLVPLREQSHNGLITAYAKKGDGYTGALMERNTWQIVMTLIKYAQKSTQSMFYGCNNYSFQYKAAVERADNDTYFPVTKAQAANIIVGSRVSVGYGYIASGALSTDRYYGNLHKYADEAKVLRIEPIDDATSAVYLDVTAGFPTAKVALNDTITSDVYISSMHWHSGVTDAVIGHKDGTPISNTDGKRPYRVQGVEYAVGGYFTASDAAFEFTDAAGAKRLRVCPDGVAHTSNDATIKAKYITVGDIPGGDYWIGDILIDPETCTSCPAAKGGGSSVGMGDYWYGGGTPAAGTLREALLSGDLWTGLNAGPSCASAWVRLGYGSWTSLAAD